MNYDGSVSIGILMDTKELEKDLKEAEKRLKSFESDTEKLTKRKAKLEIDTKSSEKNIEILNNKIDQSYQKLQQEKQKLASIPTWKQESPEYQRQVEAVNKIQTSYNNLLSKHEIALSKLQNQEGELENINSKITANVNEQNLLNNRIDEMNTKLRQAKGLDSVKNSINEASKSMTGVIKKVGKWALAIFSVRSAYMFVRQAISTISQYNEQVGTDIEYIRYALASTLQPVVERIVKLVYTLLQYVGYIAKAWFGIDLFKGAKSFESMNKSSKQIAKNLKQTTSFDEMNILSDSSTSGGGGGITAPSVDLSNWDNIEMPAWVKWIAENKDLILGFLKDFALLLGAIKIGEFVLDLGKIGKAFTDLDSIVKGLGIGLVIAGASIAIKGIIDFLKDPTWNNFLTILEGILLVISGIAVLVGGWTVALVALGAAIVTYVIKNWDKVKEILGKVGDWIYEHIVEPVGNFFSNMWGNIKEGASDAWEGIKKAFSKVGEFFGSIFNTIKTKLSSFGSKAGDVIGSAFKSVVNGVLKAIESILNTPIKTINSLINVINKVPGINLKKLSTFSLPRLAKGGIISQPGRGVPVGYGQAIGGERGREGVIPLTDAQQMAMLGEAIGKYININLTNVTKLDNRVISREQKRINTQNDFAFNR